VKKAFPFLALLFLFSCTPKPDVTPDQIAQYDQCKKVLVENKAAFIASGESKERQDSLADYIADIEKNSFPDLLQKYEVPQEQVVLFLFSICQNADAIGQGPSVEETMQLTDSMIRVLDAAIKEDSMKRLK
jgi:hypothetical protein